MANSQQWQDEITKAELQLALFRNYLDDGAVDLKSLLFMDDQKLFAGKQIKNGSLKISPFAMVQKLTNEQMKKAKVVVTMLKDRVAYQVQQPKLDLKKGTGAIAPFFWIAATTDKALANMTLSDVKVQGNLLLSIPCFKNKGQIEEGEQLMYEKEKEDAKGDGGTQDEQAKKKQKKS